MRIGIVTQPLVANYGGILQNYALQQVLKEMGHNPVTLNYMPSLKFGRYLLYAGKALLCAPIPSKRHPIKPYRHYLKRPAVTDAFISDNIVVTKIVPDYTRRLLRKNKIDAIILGSDQVWRYRYNAHYWDDMFLAFAKDYPCHKIAYAASFGMEKWDCPKERLTEARELIKQFNAVSVREDTGVGICRNSLGVDAVTVLDPTLLLTASDYERFCFDPVPSQEPYLAAYVLDKSEEKTGLIEEVAKNKGLIIKEMAVYKSGLTIERWLSEIKNASFVITDSYHGSIFSVIFGKQFQTLINRGRGADRFITLFNKLGLEDRLIDSSGPLTMLDTKIDYSSVYPKLQLLREESMSFLKTALE